MHGRFDSTERVVREEAEAGRQEAEAGRQAWRQAAKVRRAILPSSCDRS